MTDELKTVTVSAWGLTKLRMYAASSAITYLEHFATDGLLNMDEFNTMERWKRLDADLSGREFKPTDPSAGKVRDFDATLIE